MKMRVLLSVTLTLLMLPSILWSMEAAPLAGAPGPTRHATNPDPDKKLGTRTLKYYPLKQAAFLIQDITPPGEVDVTADAPTNSLTVTAPPALLQQIGDLLRILDNPELVGPVDRNLDMTEIVQVFRLKHCRAAKAVRALGNAFGDRSRPASDSFNNALVVSTASRYIEPIKAFIGVLDSPLFSSSADAPGAQTRQMEESVTRIYKLRYTEADYTVRILTVLLSKSNDIKLVANTPANQILVSASPASQQQVGALIEELDTPRVSPSEHVQMMCRVYMLELPPANPDFTWFSITLGGTGEIPAESVVSAMQYPDLQIRDVSRHGNNPWELRIQGRAPSQARVLALARAFPDAQISDFSWEDNSATTSVQGPEYQASQPLQEHLQKLLGKDLQTVGYWFGDLSLPGTIRAPIGPWTLQLDVVPEQGDELSFAIGVEAELPDGQRSQIIGNEGRSRIGKPIIIGYNRDRDGTRTMGALVIIPEPADPAL